MRYQGEIASLFASVGWAGSALFFEFSSRRIGSQYVNLWRLLWAFVLLWIVNGIFCHSFLQDIFLTDVAWLLLSGFVGFFVGDMFLFQSFVMIGSRLSLLIMLAHPLLSAVVAFFLFGEMLGIRQWIAMGGTLLSIAGVLVFHQREEQREKAQDTRSLFVGILAALVGMMGQSGGALLAKPALFHAGCVFEATWLRIIGGLGGFVLWLIGKRAFREWIASFGDRKAIAATIGGSFFGPFLGVSLFLVGMKYAPLGVASTLSSLAPLLLLVVDRVRGKKLHAGEIPLTVAACGFLAMFFL
ncbi:MAG: DMT family transporter [Brevinematales bacterium]|nr:DMT family transporter [Brevinematales bacterium]